MEISIPIPSIEPSRLRQCLDSLEKYSRYSHEILIMFDQHGKTRSSISPAVGKKQLREMDDFTFSSKKHKIRIFKSNDYDPPLWSRHLAWENHHNKYIVSLYAFGISQSTNDWILTIVDEDFTFLPDWDYHFLKNIKEKERFKSVHTIRVTVPRERPRLENLDFFEILDVKPLKMSHIVNSIDNRKIERVEISAFDEKFFGNMYPLLIHKDLLRLAGNSKNLFKSMCNIWKSKSFEHDLEDKFVELHVRRACCQSTSIFHYKYKVILDV